MLPVILHRKKLGGHASTCNGRRRSGALRKLTSSAPPDGPETKIKVTHITFAALNLFYPRSIQALSGVNQRGSRQ
jgi:hypothetical protein